MILTTESAHPPVSLTCRHTVCYRLRTNPYAAPLPHRAHILLRSLSLNIPFPLSRNARILFSLSFFLLGFSGLLPDVPPCLSVFLKMQWLPRVPLSSLRAEDH